MIIKAFAVIDTNVVISSLISESSFPAQICNLIESGNIIPLFDKRMLIEYYKVINYPKFEGKFSQRNAYESLYEIVSNGLLVNNVEKTKTELHDKDDVPFFEVKESTEEAESYLVTGNIKHFPESDTIVTPHTMIAIMNQTDRILKGMESQFKYDVDYNQSIEKMVKDFISTSKFTSGKSLLNKMFDKERKEIKREFFER